MNDDNQTRPENRNAIVAGARLIVLGIAIVLTGTWLVAEEPEAKTAPPLPTDKNLWLNSSPYTWEHLRGKGVCLYFFQCDTEGIEELPKYLESAKRHMLDPVVFIGVSVGSDRSNTEPFLRGAKYNWPTLCDPTYTYSRLCDSCVGSKKGDEIVNSVCAAAYVTAQGKMIEGWWDDPEATVAEALDGAQWVTNPKEIPELLWPTWRAVEFRKYSEALPLIRKSLNSGSDAQKAAAKTLQDVVLSEIEQLSSAVRSADEADQKWKAYCLISKIEERFRGYEIPKDLDPLQKKLLRSVEVKAGIVAEKQLPTIMQNFASSNAALRKKAQTQLEKIVSDFPDSELAEKVQLLLDTPQSLPK